VPAAPTLWQLSSFQLHSFDAHSSSRMHGEPFGAGAPHWFVFQLQIPLGHSTSRSHGAPLLPLEEPLPDVEDPPPDVEDPPLDVEDPPESRGPPPSLPGSVPELPPEPDPGHAPASHSPKRPVAEDPPQATRRNAKKGRKTKIRSFIEGRAVQGPCPRGAAHFCGGSRACVNARRRPTACRASTALGNGRRPW
jgi:hypothetical protein